MRRLRLFIAMAMALLPFMAGAQVYVSDLVFSAYPSTFSSIALTGTEMTSLRSGLNVSEQLSLPFVFPFGQDTCSVITVGSNGQIGIGTNDPCVGGYYSAHINDMSIISPLGASYNLSDGGSGHVYYETRGTAPSRSVVIEYNDPAINNIMSNTLIFQVVLWETGDIDFIYDTCQLDENVAGDFWIFVREHGANKALSLSGSWSNPVVSQNISPVEISSTDYPAQGLTLSFVRDERSCLRPLNFVCRSFSRPDSVCFAWNSAPYTDMWELRYDTVGTPVDSMQNTVQYYTDTIYVCSTMVAGGVYEAYLRTDCGSEQSFWVGPVVVTPGSYNMPVSGYNTIYACGGTIYDDGGATGDYSVNCNSTLVIMPTSPDSLVTISGTINSETNYDFLYIYDGIGTSGVLLSQIHGAATIPTISSYSGPLTIRFISDGSVVRSGFALSVSCVAAPPCRSVNHAEISHIAGASAFVEWDLVGSTAIPSYYVVRIENLTNPAFGSFEDTTSNLFYFFSGLNQLTTYRATISSICNGDTVFGDSISFTTRSLSGGVSLPSGNGTLQTSGVPVMSSYGNSFCQSIYTPAELISMGVAPGPIEGITYTWASGGSYNKDIVIFMGHTTNTVFSTNTPLTGSMTQVYSGTRTTSDVGTIEYPFTTPFVWDGIHSIVLTSFVNQPSGSTHYSSGFNGYSTSCGVNRSIYAYKDNTAYTVSNLTSSSIYYSTSRPNVSFIMPLDTLTNCVPPNPIVTEVLSDTIKFIWAPGYRETMWTIMYKAEDSTNWITAVSNTTDNSYAIGDLTPMTTYQVRIYPDCDSSDVYAMFTATTPCVPLTTLPFTENFENFTAASTAGSPITPCWTRGTNSSSSYPYLSTSYSNSGSHSMYFYASSTYYSYLALPAIGISLDSLQVSFALYKTSSSYNIQVGVMSDPNDFSTFRQVAMVTPSTISTWENFEVPLTNADSNSQYIAFSCNGASSYPYLDDIEVTYIPSCIRPRNVTVSTITANTATVNWDAPGVNFFEIEYGPVGFSRGTGMLVTSVVDSVTLYGLNHSTQYEVYVRGLCGIGDTSNWSFATYFNTLCGIIDSLPYSVSFGSSAHVGSSVHPYCWTYGGYSSYPYIIDVTCNADHTTHRTLYMYTYSSNQVYASMPELDSISYPVNMVQAVFKAWTNQTTTVPQCIVGVCSVAGDLSTFTPVDTILIDNNPTLYEVSFEEALDAGKYITFVSVTPAGMSNNPFYIDSVNIDLIPACQTPNRLTVSNTTYNSAVIGWNPRSYATQWQVEYGPHGFMLGTGTRMVVSTNPVTLTGLTPSSFYDIYIRTICGIGDTSAWAVAVGYFNTQQVPASVPYFYDFESATEWENWQTNSNTTVNWYRGTGAGDGTPGYTNLGSYAMYVSADSGRTYSTDLNQVVNASAYRDIDFGTNDSSFILSFRAAAGGTPTQGWDALMVFLVDPNIPVVASNSNITSPWGMVNDLTPLAMVRLNTVWNTYSVVLDTLSGVHRLAFFWFNQSTASTPYMGGPAAVDNVRIDYVDCPRPVAVQATHTTMTTADVEWIGPEEANYHFLCRTATGNVVANERINTNHIHVTGLTPGVRYNVYVRRICSENDSSTLSLSYQFMTKQCNDSYFDTIGSTATTTTSYNLPVNNYYRYTYSQQIITSDELSGAGSISAISFKYAYTTAMSSKTNCTIYMGHTTLSSFSSSNDYVNPDSMQLVYTGTLNCAEGWNRFILNYPFEYDGASNLVIAIDDNSNAYDGSDYFFYVSNTADAKSLVLYSDSQNPNVNALPAFTGTRVVYAYRNLMAFEFCPPSTCPKPTVLNPVIRPNTVTLRWRNTGSSYQIGYRLASTSSWITNDYVVNDTFYVINNVLPVTDYVYQVRQICDSTGISNWEVRTFNSDDIPCLSPNGLRVDEVTNSKVTLRWDPEQNNNSYRVHLFNSYTDRYSNSYVAHKTISGLDPNMVYYAAVQASCQDIDDPSEWSDTISFTTDFCPDVTNLTYSDLQGNSVVLDWTEGGRASRWEIEYGYSGFDQGTGFVVQTDTHPYTLTGLVGESSYDIYVRAICGDNFFSEHWSNLITITTPFSNIDDITDDGGVRLVPNPTSTDVTLTVPIANSEVRVEVIDLTGRVRFSQQLAPGTETTVLPASLLAQGAYFVRITADNTNVVRKLIVR